MKRSTGGPACAESASETTSQRPLRLNPQIMADLGWVYQHRFAIGARPFSLGPNRAKDRSERQY